MADMVEQEVREAYMNSTLAKHWLAGEDWAALDYNGLELNHAAASAHQAKIKEVMLLLLLLHKTMSPLPYYNEGGIE